MEFSDDDLAPDGGQPQLFDDLAEPDDDPDGPNLPRHLSPSSASTYDQCPRRWQFRYLERLPDPPGEPALAGSFAHRVLELLLQGDPASRTVERARVLARQVWPEIESDRHFADLSLDDAAARRFRWKAWNAIEGLWKLEDPTRVWVEATEQDMRTTIGTVPFRGVIDRLDREHDGMVVTDYKSGRAPSLRYREQRLAQVFLYAAAVEADTNERPKQVRLLYLGQKTVEAEVTEEALGKAVADLTATWNAVCSDVSTGAFDVRPGPLCAWCPFASRCPEGQAEIGRRNELGLVRADAPGLPALAGVA